MFFFIAGIGPRKATLDQQARTCPNCGRFTLHLQRIDQYLSLFLIPLIPVKRGKPFLSCEACGADFEEQGKYMFQDRLPRDQTCRHCGRAIESDFAYCPSCGNPIVFRTRT